MRSPVAAVLTSFLGAATTALAQENAATPPPAPKCLAITFDEVSVLEVDPDGDGPKPATRENREMKWVATLGPRCLAVLSGDTLQTWDFAAGVVRSIDRAAGTYTEVSVLHEVAFVQNEMQNRLGLKRVLQSASVPIADEWAPFDLAVLFTWPVEGDEVELEHVEKDGAFSSLRDGQAVANWSLGEHELDAAQRALFGRLLQRRAHLHPKSLAALLATARLPKELVFRWRNVGVRATTTWRLTEVRADAVWPGSVDGAKRSFGTGPLARIAAMVQEPTAAGVPERLTAARFGELADAARDAGRYGDAVMLLLEASLSTGDPMPQMRKLATDPAAKEQVQRFMRPISLANRDPERALALFERIDRADLSRPAILGVFRVAALTAKREVGAAREVMLEALEASPWITMGYKDLGDLYMAEFETAQAWTAWELGRRIAPEHGCWGPVEAYEQQLRSTFADRL